CHSLHFTYRRFSLFLAPPLPTHPVSPYTTLFRSLPIDLGGKVALVTGVGDNVGFAWHIAKALQAAGARRALAMSQANPTLSPTRSEEHTSELQSLAYLVCRLLLEKKKHTEDQIPQ